MPSNLKDTVGTRIRPHTLKPSRNWCRFRSVDLKVDFDYEAWNRYVLVIIGVFGTLLYLGLMYAGFHEFRTRLSKPKSRKNGRNQANPRRLRNSKASGN
jgi:hypothetical protein